MGNQMESENWFNECIEMLEKLVVLRSFMSQKARRRLKRACRANKIKHLLSQKDIAELVDHSKSKPTGCYIVLRCEEKPKARFVVTNRQDLAMLIKNSRYLLKHDLHMN